MQVKKPVLLKDCLYNWHPRSGASDQYCHGLTVGVVAGLMAMGHSFDSAITQMALYSPEYSRQPLPVPESWEKALRAEWAATTPLKRGR